MAESIISSWNTASIALGDVLTLGFWKARRLIQILNFVELSTRRSPPCLSCVAGWRNVLSTRGRLMKPQRLLAVAAPEQSAVSVRPAL